MSLAVVLDSAPAPDTVPSTRRRPVAPRPATCDLASLVERAAARDEAAAAELMERCRSFVAHTARHYLSTPEDVEDVMQEVWLSLVREIGRIRSPELILGWLKKVTEHAAIRQGQRTSRMVTGREIDEWAGDESAEDAGIEEASRDRLRAAVREAMFRLRPADRQLLERLMAVDRPDYRSIGEELNRPVGSLGPTRKRILERLRDDPAIARLAIVA
jgi:RNA polymerase sigma factor (sigma-70 family)